MQRNSKIQRTANLFRKKPPPSRKKPPKKISEQRAEELPEYYKLVEEVLKERPECELRIEGICTLKATTVHHSKGRGIYYLVKKFMKSSCLACHDRVTIHSKEAIETGRSERRIT